MVKKIVWISSYLPRSCGIAYYSNHYIRALKNYSKKHNKKISVKIIAHTDAKESDFPIINQRDKNWNKKVFSKIKKEKPDIVHIQHEYGLYETYNDNNKRLVELIKAIKEENIPVVMTYHSIFRKLEKPHKEFVSETLKLLDAGVFHEDYQKKALKKNIGWTPKNVYVLPHGSREDLKLDKEKIRKDLNYGDKFIVGSAGLADERKGFRTLIHQWPKVVKKFPNAILSLELKPHVSKVTRLYINEVMKEIMKSPVSRNIEIIVKDYGEMEFYKRLKSFDILVLPYRTESQSGVLAHGFSVATPAIVTDIEGLGAEIRNSKAGIPVKNRANFYRAIIRLLKNLRLRKKFSKNALKYVKTISSWSIIAKKTFKIYEKFY